MEKIPALVCGEIGLVRSLGREGIPLYVGGLSKEFIQLYSRYCDKAIIFSDYLGSKYIDELIELGKSVGQKMAFFSDDDRAVLSFSQNRDKLSPYYYFNLPENDLVESILDKRRFSKLAETHQLLVPRSFVPKNVEEVKQIAGEINFPCVIKPAHKDTWWNPEFKRIIGYYAKALRCDSADELIDYYCKVIQLDSEVVIQEYIEGDDTRLSSVNMYFNADGDLKAYFIGHKHRIYPIHAGAGCLVETVKNDEMVEIAIDTAKRLKMQGHFNLQFKQDSRNGKLYVMEMHTRNSLWSFLSTGSGLNISAIAYYDMIGQEHSLSTDYRTGVKWLDINKDIKASLKYAKNDELKFGEWFKSLRGKRVYHVHSWRDPMPVFAEMWFVLWRRFNKN